MNLAFLLSSFGIKLTEQDVSNLTATLQSAPQIVVELVQRVATIEKQIAEIHAALVPEKDPVQREFERQLVLFAPAPEGMTHSPEFLERMKRNVGTTDSDARNQDAGNVHTGGQQFQ